MKCALKRTEEWRSRNREKSREQSLAWYYDNREQAQARNREWVRNNKLKVIETNRIWRSKNPLNSRLARHRRRVLLRGQSSFTVEQLNTLLKLQNGHCSYCDSSDELQIDHVVPLSRGGLNIITNIQWLCRFHNQSKHDLTDNEYREKIGLPLVSRHLSQAIWGAALAL